MSVLQCFCSLDWKNVNLECLRIVLRDALLRKTEQSLGEGDRLSVTVLRARNSGKILATKDTRKPAASFKGK